MSNESKLTIGQINSAFSKLNESTVNMMRRAVDSNLQFASDMQDFFAGIGLRVPDMGIARAMGQKTHPKACQCGCCPPDCTCPPHCLAVITRRAYPGERIVVPVTVRNTTGSVKTYRVGVRELLDQQGNKAPGQPVLNQEQITLQPNQVITVLMTLDTGQFALGNYEAEVVLREKEVNQNVCFRLQVVPYAASPEVHPKEEHEYLTHFQGWQSHFYCTPKTGRTPGSQG